MSDFYVIDICTYLCYFFKFSNRRPIVKSMVVSHFLKLTSLMYSPTLTLTNKSAIDLSIWKGPRFENTFKSDCDLRWRLIVVILIRTMIWVYHIWCGFELCYTLSVKVSRHLLSWLYLSMLSFSNKPGSQNTSPHNEHWFTGLRPLDIYCEFIFIHGIPIFVGASKPQI
jgi:hypothetical protein